MDEAGPLKKRRRLHVEKQKIEGTLHQQQPQPSQSGSPSDAEIGQAVQETTLYDFPPEMLYAIFSKLDPSTPQKIRLVCRMWNAVSEELFETKLELTDGKWSHLTNCTARKLSILLTEVTQPILSDAELLLGQAPLAERLRQVEFYGAVTFNDISKILAYCHRLETLTFYRIIFDKKRQTAAARKARSGIYFPLDDTVEKNLLSSLKNLTFRVNGRDPDELRLLHHLALILNNGNLITARFEFFRDIDFTFKPIEALLGLTSQPRAILPKYNSSAAEQTEVLKYDEAVCRIITGNFGTLEELEVQLSGKELMVKFARRLGVARRKEKIFQSSYGIQQPIKSFRRFVYRNPRRSDASLNFGTTPWLTALSKEEKLTGLELDIRFTESAPRIPSALTLMKSVVTSNAKSLTTIYIDCEFPEFRDTAPFWDGRSFESCSGLQHLTLYHWQFHNLRWLGHFDNMAVCPKLIGFQYLPPSIQTFKTSLTVINTEEKFTKSDFGDRRELTELELMSMPWFLSPEGHFKRINMNRYKHMLATMPKLKKLSGRVSNIYFDAEAEVLRQATAVSIAFNERFRPNIQDDWHQSVLELDIMRGNRNAEV